MAKPRNIRFPISAEAISDCARLRMLSCGSGGGAKVGELSVLDTSVGGVEARESGGLEVLAVLDDLSSRLATRIPDADGIGASGVA